MIYIFDLDGTLVDSSDRMFTLFNSLVPDSYFTKDQYWDLKRNRINHEMILSSYYPLSSFSDFNRQWLDKIESKQYIDMDKLYDDAIFTLLELKKQYELVLLTARQSSRMLHYELTKLRIDTFFNQILVTECVKTKKELMQLNNFPKGSLYVTDMGRDVVEGNEFGLKTIGIDHGFMSREKLAEYKPSIIVHELSELLTL